MIDVWVYFDRVQLKLMQHAFTYLNCIHTIWALNVIVGVNFKLDR